MPDARRAICKDCGEHRSAVGLLSWRGFCTPCAIRRAAENAEGLSKMNNPVVTDRWRKGMILCAGGSLPEQLQPRS